MLRESRTGKSRARRWFEDEWMELIVWYAPDGEVSGFQLCYDVTGDEHAFTWQASGHLSHAAVDQGEDLPSDNRSPILVPDGDVPIKKVLAEFKRRSAELEKPLAKLVVEKLAAIGRKKR